MPNICILTDSTVQFPSPLFPGSEHVNLIPLQVRLADQVYLDGKELKVSNLPVSARADVRPEALPPSEDDFRQVFLSLGKRYNEIVVILVSPHLNPVIMSAQKAAHSVRSPASIHIIDSQTTAVGLGLLVQAAAEAVENGASSAEISRLVRGLLPRIYTVFCLQSVSYLYHSGHLDPAQAIVGEMLGVMPFFILEYGRLVPVQKIRNSRHLVDILHEFINEFGNLKHIALLHGAPPFEQEARSLRERINNDHPRVSLSEHTLGAALATILGPRSMGVVAMDNNSEM